MAKPDISDATTTKADQKRWRGRVLVLGLAFAGTMGMVAARFGDLASKHDPSFAVETQKVATPTEDLKRRVEIADRNGAPLAVGLRAYELYFDASKTYFPDDAAEAAARLAAALPGVEEEALARRFARGGVTLVKRPATPAEAQAAHDLGLPGLHFTQRMERVAVGGRAFAHLLGQVDIDGIGRSGVEGALEERLAATLEPAPPVRLTIDARVQRQTREALAAEMAKTGAKGGAAVILEADTGAVRALVSLPDYDPARPPKQAGALDESPLFARAVAGRYELGSTFKIFTWALALETGAASLSSRYGPPEPFRVGRFTIADDHPIRQPVSFAEAFAKSSNIVAARLALSVGKERQMSFLQALGLFEPTGIELVEAQGARPLWARPWGEATTATAAYGHGVAVSPLHLAAATAAVVNGGWRVRPTLLEPGPDALSARPRALSLATSDAMRGLLRKVVTDGTGRRAEVPGLEVGGKTGTAEKPDPSGGYHDDKVIATFAAAYPMSRPRYVVVAMLDEAETSDGRRSAGLTAAPAARAVIERTAALLGVAPTAPAEDADALPTADVPADR
ncbi:MAG: penicillin-binding protein 2 [Pseudomonadota bacterium]